ncbi:MAG: hypothetical protein OXG16_10985 [Rhodospirillales bacterium]|nr:hypothetical protein [Rhodospirillales bacterium]MDE0712599.1 hypothetical protein [Rhodospirillales bacterium]
MADAKLTDTERAAARHMRAAAELVAHYVDVAARAGASADDINAVLSRVVAATVLAEIWVTDETGKTQYSSTPGTAFTFPSDPAALGQAAPFAMLLTGQAVHVEQGVQPRELDGKHMMYVGVAGVDRPRIVQVGLSEADVAT